MGSQILSPYAAQRWIGRFSMNGFQKDYVKQAYDQAIVFQKCTGSLFLELDIEVL